MLYTNTTSGHVGLCFHFFLPPKAYKKLQHSAKVVAVSGFFSVDLPKPNVAGLDDPRALAGADDEEDCDRHDEVDEDYVDEVAVGADRDEVVTILLLS